MTTTQKIEMTRMVIQSVPGYSYNEVKLTEVCESNEFIPDGSLVMQNNGEKVYYENGAFVTKKDGTEIRRFEKSTMSESQLLQLFAIWASKNI